MRQWWQDMGTREFWVLVSAVVIGRGIYALLVWLVEMVWRF